MGSHWGRFFTRSGALEPTAYGRPAHLWTCVSPRPRPSSLRRTLRGTHGLASAAVEAALDAGARYADALVMEMRAESMAAHNGVVEILDRDERAGIGVRALIGSSWGFHA